jgi:hypothetical protein
MPTQTTWKKPLWEDEVDEIRRTARSLRVPMKVLKEAFFRATLRRVNDALWKQIENTESWGTTTWGQVTAFADEYGRDAESIRYGLENHEAMPTPILLLREGKRPYLVAGNTRLMVCRALGLRPLALFLSDLVSQ